MVAVMIGVDPHKGSHTAVAISVAEKPLGDLRVREDSTGQAGRRWWRGRRNGRNGPGRSEGAAGLGHAAGPAARRRRGAGAGRAAEARCPGAAARRRVTRTRTIRMTPGRSRSRRCGPGPSRDVTAEDHGAVLKIWAKRHRDLARARNQVACRLHAVICDLVPGGVSKEITAGHATSVLEQVTPSGPVAAARRDLAAQFVEDLRRLDTQLRRPRRSSPRRSGHRAPPDRGIRYRPGQRRDHHRRRQRHHPVPQPRPLRRLQRHRPGRGVVRQPQDLPPVAAREPAHEPRHPHGRHYPDPPCPHRRPRLLRPENSSGKNPQRCPPLPQAEDQRRHLRPPASRRPEG